jgi:tetratricopeptide (TPR) repeat protein
MATSGNEILHDGLRHHLAGRLDDARSHYRDIIDADPTNAEALHLLGDVYRQAGDPLNARKNLEAAIALNPNFAEALNTLGIVLMEQGLMDDARQRFERAVELVPGFAAAWSNLGNLRRQLGDLDGAFFACERALTIDPGLAQAQNNAGLVLAALGRHADAVASFEAAVATAPNMTDALVNLAEGLRRMRRTDDALAAAERAVATAPNLADAHNCLGNVHFDREEFDAAEQSYRRAIDLAPAFATAHNNLGNVGMRRDDPETAIAAYTAALAEVPDYVDALANLGAALQAAARPDEAIAALDKAVAADPNHADAHWNRGIVLLQLGELAGGFAEYEWRWKLDQFVPARFDAPLWNGREIGGKTLLIHSEQGFGDTIFGLRYAAMLAKCGIKVVVQTHKELARLAATATGVDRVVAAGEQPDGFDVHVPIMSLPHVLATDAQSIPADVPYLFAPEDGPAAPAIADAPGLKVGIAWAGRPTQRNDRTRSCPLDHFGALAEIDGLSLFGLQVGERAGDLAHVPWGGDVTDLSGGLKDFADTASAMAALDLIVTVDTAVAHLAGALARPVWTLVSFAPDWRYGLGRDDHPWYPTMRLFRQTMPGDWPGVMSRVAAALAEKI